MDFDGISSEFGNDYFGKYGRCGGRKYLSTDWECYITHEGQKFEDGVCEFRDKLAKYLIENDFKIKYLKNELRCVTVVCVKKESNGYKVRSNPLVRPIELITDLKDNYGLDIPYHVACNVKSHCVLACGEDGSRFQQILICFKASIDGFRWCRPMLFIDGTFVNEYKDTLLGATAKNGNEEVFPFAFAIVSSETVDNWRWFLQRISEVLVVLLAML
ncbi:hypothetical protein L3X38_033647 [Prunus dulcis]|uniref:MULE transposase domain-containing protein n=1 Tax=Prunus dulcis TaxID=3755 RepID=A0AAD4VHS4_PRUDU|nr:hypothetical protein L3X38_033647 [Prunus dulcis]